jgi:hypothetical protein
MQVRQLDTGVRMLLPVLVQRHLSPLAWQKSQARDTRCLFRVVRLETSAPQAVVAELDDMLVS